MKKETVITTEKYYELRSKQIEKLVSVKKEIIEYSLIEDIQIDKEKGKVYLKSNLLEKEKELLEVPSEESLVEEEDLEDYFSMGEDI